MLFNVQCSMFKVTQGNDEWNSNHWNNIAGENHKKDIFVSERHCSEESI